MVGGTTERGHTYTHTHEQTHRDHTHTHKHTHKETPCFFYIKIINAYQELYEQCGEIHHPIDF